MKTFGKLLMIGMACCTPLYAQVKSKARKGKSTLYVSSVKMSPSLQGVVGKQKDGIMAARRVQSILETQMRMKLARTGLFSVVERKELKELEAENELAVATADKEQDRLMRFKGADFAVFVELTSFDFNEEERSYDKINQRQVHRKIDVSASARVVDVVSGEIKHSVPSISLKDTQEGDLIRAAEKMTSEKFLVNSMAKLSDQLIAGFIFNVRPPKVLAVTNGRLLINRGENIGLKKGDIIEVYASEEVEDDDTGEIFLNEYPVAKAKIVSCDFRKCYAVIQGDNLGVAKGCTVRPVTEDK